MDRTEGGREGRGVNDCLGLHAGARGPPLPRRRVGAGRARRAGARLRGLVLGHVEEAVNEVDDAVGDGAVHLLRVAERLRHGGGDHRVDAAGALGHDGDEAAEEELELGELLGELHGGPLADGGGGGAVAVRVEAGALEARDALLEVEGVGAQEAGELPALRGARGGGEGERQGGRREGRALGEGCRGAPRGWRRRGSC